MAQTPARIVVLLSLSGWSGYTQSPSSDFKAYCNDHGWFISELPKEKLNDQKVELRPIEIFDLNKIDFKALGIEFSETDYQYFLIINQDKLLAIKPLKLIRREWEQAHVPHE